MPIEWTHFASLLFTCAGVIVFIALFAIDQTLKRALPLALDFWMGAGLLKLSGSPSWNLVVTVAAIVILRKIVTLRLSFFNKIS